MKKIVIAIALIIAPATFNSCTDTNDTLKELKIKNEEKKKLQLIDPSEDGEIPTEPIQEGGS